MKRHRSPAGRAMTGDTIGNTNYGAVEADLRTLRLAEYLVASGDTVRGAAQRFGVSKSTVHKDVTVRLAALCPPLCGEVNAVLQKNKAERHLRGGEATRRKYHPADET